MYAVGCQSAEHLPAGTKSMVYLIHNVISNISFSPWIESSKKGPDVPCVHQFRETFFRQVFVIKCLPPD